MSPPAHPAFWNIYKQYVSARGLDRNGICIQEVISNLGEPDIFYQETVNRFYIVYGLCEMLFINNQLVAHHELGLDYQGKFCSFLWHCGKS